jgi:single-strand DNA-binding protein
MNCSCFGNCADNTAKFTRKGSLVAIEGRLTQRKYNRKSDNALITTTDIVCDSVEFLDPKGTVNVSASGYTPDTTRTAPAAPKMDDGKNLDPIDVTDDDLPF